uniref:hypothetical protein n=1 Tax=Pedobacter schmidteae TaxID=2201271 RepID=UPI000EB2A950|nr:hypothetical protein [Pedobacter schmidteae]
MKKLFIITCFLSGFAFCAQAQKPVGLKISKPLSMEDKAAVEELLKSFDPQTYSFNANYKDASGKVKTTSVGKAKGLGNVKLENTRVIKPSGGAVAGTVNTNNIFKAATVNTNNIFVASTVNKNNIFVAATVNKNNIFKPSDDQLSKMQQLHTILSKY